MFLQANPVSAGLRIWNATNSRWKSWRKYMPFQKTFLLTKNMIYMFKFAVRRKASLETLAHLIDAKVLNYIQQSEFESLYNLIREAEQALNGFMAYVRRQRAGAKEFGDKTIHEENANYDLALDEGFRQE